jgi:hypothetical protein
MGAWGPPQNSAQMSLPEPNRIPGGLVSKTLRTMSVWTVHDDTKGKGPHSHQALGVDLLSISTATKV